MNIKSDIRVTDSCEEACIDIEGVIGVPEQLQFAAEDERVATYGRFAAALAAVKELKAPRIVVNIRSTGGDVNDALLIYEALKESGAVVVTRCYGYVASAATIIAQAASDGCREISPRALYLIHCSESAAEGNSLTLSAAKELLDRTDERISSLYAERSGRPAESFAALMNENAGKGRWITAGEAISRGLADRLTDAVVTNEAAGSGEGGEELAELCRMFGISLPPESLALPGSDETARPEGEVIAKYLRRLLRRLLGGSGKHGNRAVKRHSEEPPSDAVAGLSAAAEAVSGAPETDVGADGGLEGIPPSTTGHVSAAVCGGHSGCEARVQDKTVIIAIRSAQSEAFATCTKAVEDPSVDERDLSPNQRAYIQDAMNMQRRG